MTDDEHRVLRIVEALVDVRHPVKDETSQWARTELAGRDLVEADRTSAFAHEDWRRCADHGILGLLVAPEFGGVGADLATALLRLEGLGHGCADNGFTYAITSQILSTQFAIERFGDDDQKRRWLPSMCDGSVIGAFAITEPDSGSDVTALQTTATKAGSDTYRLTGRKAYLTLGSRCDVVVTFAMTAPERGRWGISAFVIPADLPGVTRLANAEKMGMRTTPFGDIEFDDVEVDASMRLGAEGAGFSIFSATLDAERAFVFAPQLGMMERQLDESIEYARSRRQGGRPIGEYQSVSNRIADMKVRHETARVLMYRAALDVVQHRSATMSAALAKLVASEAALDSSLDATRIHGARGYVTGFEVERNLRDAVGGVIYSGTSDVQRNIVARLLGVG